MLPQELINLVQVINKIDWDLLREQHEILMDVLVTVQDDPLVCKHLPDKSLEMLEGLDNLLSEIRASQVEYGINS